MTRAEEMIRWIIGTDFKECYVVLSQAIDVAYGALPEKLSIGDIGRQVHIQTGKGKTAVSKRFPGQLPRYGITGIRQSWRRYLGSKWNGVKNRCHGIWSLLWRTLWKGGW